MLTLKKLQTKLKSTRVKNTETFLPPILTVYPKPPVELKGGKCKFEINNTLKELLEYKEITANSKIYLSLSVETTDILICGENNFEDLKNSSAVLNKSLTFNSKDYHKTLVDLNKINPEEVNYFYATKLLGYGFPVCLLKEVKKEDINNLPQDISSYINTEVEQIEVVETIIDVDNENTTE